MSYVPAHSSRLTVEYVCSLGRSCEMFTQCLELKKLIVNYSLILLKMRYFLHFRRLNALSIGRTSQVSWNDFFKTCVRVYVVFWIRMSNMQNLKLLLYITLLWNRYAVFIWNGTIFFNLTLWNKIFQ